MPDELKDQQEGAERLADSEAKGTPATDRENGTDAGTTRGETNADAANPAEGTDTPAKGEEISETANPEGYDEPQAPETDEMTEAESDEYRRLSEKRRNMPISPEEDLRHQELKRKLG